MNVFLLPEEKNAEPTPTLGAVHAAISPTAPDEKALAALLETAENAEQKRRVVQETSRFFAFLWLAGFCAYLVVITVCKSRWWSLITLAVINGPRLLKHLKYSRPCYQHLKNAAASLLQLPDDPRMLLPLVDAHNLERTPEWKAAIYPVLTEHLWRLTPTDVTLSLDDTRRGRLRETLGCAYSFSPFRPFKARKVEIPGYFDDVTTDLAVAIIKTLAGIGDKKSVKVLEKIIKAEANTPNETVVRDAAREYLPVLKKALFENGEIQKGMHHCLGGSSAYTPQQMLGKFLDDLTPETAKAALAELIQTQRRDFVKMCLSVSGLVLPFVLLCTAQDLHKSSQWVSMLQFFGVFLLIIIGLPFAAISVVLTFSGSGNSIICDELAKRSANDMRLLPLLLHAAHWELDSKKRDTLKKALVQLLPLLQLGDATLVPPAQRAYLRSWLKIPRNKKRAARGSKTLTIAALNAIAAIGDTKSLRAAEEITRQTLRGNYYESELHEAAVRCVEALRARRDL